jgi:hypothetical protein
MDQRAILRVQSVLVLNLTSNLRHVPNIKGEQSSNSIPQVLLIFCLIN